MRLSKLWLAVRNSLWVVPVLFVLGGVVLALATVAIDRRFDYSLIPASVVGGPEASITILSTVAASMVSMAALVLTITMVVVQLAMGQFSPRIVQRLLRDKPSQSAIGLFVATFAFAIVTLNEVTSNGDGTGNVPGTAVLTAFVLVIVSIAVLIIYVHHIGQALRVSSLIELVGKQTRKLLDEVYPDKGDLPDDGRVLIRAPKSGVITVIGYEHLVREAARAGCVLELLPALGEFVPAGAPLFEVHGDPVGLDEGKVNEAVVLGLERTLDKDVAYGLRLLVDIAQRSLSDSPLQDPTTAVQAIDRLHDCLRQLATRPLSDGLHRDASGEVRLREPAMDWDAYVHLAFDEIRIAGATSPQVSRRLIAAVQDISSVAPSDRLPALERQLALLTEAVQESSLRPGDIDTSLAPDRQGLGVAAGHGERR
ncbi:hypothetical protein ASE38_00375 [Cellulomonas sp. Root930]|nr:hypothetical protein ASE38_00375 [Cellulomonas sp. Root930]